ncbi:MAG TPA: hypothetical protein VLI90_17780, partial [Tepidisphaeraceae bacterium]|nr:hypothetical protein [Tepidisphaeraceae bacterium]
MKKLIALSVMMTVAGCAPAHPESAAGVAPEQRAWMDRSLPPERRAQLLVGQMTLDEKILQIHMVDQKDRPREVAPVPRLGIPTFRITNGPAGAGPGDAKPTQPATALP